MQLIYPRWRTSCRQVAEKLSLAVLTLAAVVAAVSGRALSRDISTPREISPRSREISLSDEMKTRCPPVPHDVLWLRLNMAPRTHTNRHQPSYGGLGSSDRKPEVDMDFRYRQDGGRRRRRERQRRQRRHWRKQWRRRRRDDNRGAWLNQCHVTRHWVRMPSDVFPPYLQTGSCSAESSQCIVGLYECRDVKYATRVLRRLPARCNPLPLTAGSDVTKWAGFEEAWLVEEYHVTVGCECVRRQAWYSPRST